MRINSGPIEHGYHPSILAKGDVGGFMVWSNRRYLKDDQSLQMRVCETYDQLIAGA